MTKQQRLNDEWRNVFEFWHRAGFSLIAVAVPELSFADLAAVVAVRPSSVEIVSMPKETNHRDVMFACKEFDS